MEDDNDIVVADRTENLVDAFQTLEDNDDDNAISREWNSNFFSSACYTRQTQAIPQAAVPSCSKDNNMENWKASFFLLSVQGKHKAIFDFSTYTEDVVIFVTIDGPDKIPALKRTSLSAFLDVQKVSHTMMQSFIKDQVAAGQISLGLASKKYNTTEIFRRMRHFILAPHTLRGYNENHLVFWILTGKGRPRDFLDGNTPPGVLFPIAQQTDFLTKQLEFERESSRCCSSCQLL